MRMHRGEKIYKCIQCDKLFGQAAHLKTHLDYHAGVRKFSCEHCNKSFTQSSHLNIHKRTQHSSVKPYKCKYCSKEFGYLFGLTSHSHKNLTFKNDIEVQKIWSPKGREGSHQDKQKTQEFANFLTRKI